MNTAIHHRFPFDKLLPSALGFDNLFDTFETLVNQPNVTYPPVNITKLDDEKYAIELAIAGFRKREISITLQENRLTITGEKKDQDEKNYLVRGIASRSFQRTFILADSAKVNSATFDCGILTINIDRVVPEKDKVKTIEIT